MGNLFKWLAQLSRPAQVGLVAAGGIAAVGGVTLANRNPQPAMQVVEQPAALAVADTEEIEGFGQGEMERGATPVELEVDPEVVQWPDEHSVEISGTTAIDAENPRVTITVVSPSGRSYELAGVPVSPDGSFSTELELHEMEPEVNASPEALAARPRLELGEFRVAAASPGGFGTGSASFKVTKYNEVERFDWQEPGDRLAKKALDIVANLKTCIGNMAVSPAREELKSQLAQLETTIQQGGTPTVALGSLLAAVMTELKEMPDEAPSMEKVLEPLEDALDDWGTEVERFEDKVDRDMTRCSSVTSCDRADMITQDLDQLSELMTLLRKPVELIGGYEQSPELAAALRKETMLDTYFLNQKLRYAKATLEGRASGGLGLGNLSAWFNAARSAMDRTRSYAQRELFEPYCKKFEGPVSVSMAASFASRQGRVWWRYQVKLDGQLTLRYPSSASGAVIPMTGELTGCASGFKSWDDALRVGWPKLMAGALLYRTASEPFPGSCAPFDLPVKAELRGDEIELELLAARRDYGEPTTRVRYVVISPLAGGLPAQTSFELPYKSAHFIMTRSMDDKPLKMRVRQVGREMVVVSDLNARRGSGRAEGTYTGSIKLCNPSCGAGAGSKSTPKM
ncbi:MAG TPA: hypothetical protein VJ596_03050 [Gemmatimonadaceae bacterium]|nr:hypothetical protein [Gemmatimonadaceae bacterium]